MPSHAFGIKNKSGGLSDIAHVTCMENRARVLEIYWERKKVGKRA